MHFKGFTQVTIDDKNRLKLPVHVLKIYQEKFGDQANTFDCCISFRKSIALFPPGEFQKYLERMKIDLEFDDPSNPNVLAIKLSYDQLEMDGNGRIKLNAKLLRRVEIEREALLCGFSSHLELYAEPVWDAYLDRAINSSLRDPPPSAGGNGGNGRQG